MVGKLLMLGMLSGLLAGFLCFAFLKAVGEPQIDRAIAFEAQMEGGHAHHHDEAAGAAHAHADAPPELVSRPVQAGVGLLTGVAVYSTAFGGLFALVFALASARVARLGPRATAALLAAMGFVAVYLVPNPKYPANPPGAGAAETIGMRTALFFAMIALSLAAMIAAAVLRNRLLARYGTWNASLVAGVAYLVAAAVLVIALPNVDEVPAEFPADVLWRFRIASVGAQAIMWIVIGLAFGTLAERTISTARPSRTLSA